MMKLLVFANADSHSLERTVVSAKKVIQRILRPETAKLVMFVRSLEERSTAMDMENVTNMEKTQSALVIKALSTMALISAQNVPILFSSTLTVSLETGSLTNQMSAARTLTIKCQEFCTNQANHQHNNLISKETMEFLTGLKDTSWKRAKTRESQVLISLPYSKFQFSDFSTIQANPESLSSTDFLIMKTRRFSHPWERQLPIKMDSWAQLPRLQFFISQSI